MVFLWFYLSVCLHASWPMSQSVSVMVKFELFLKTSAASCQICWKTCISITTLRHLGICDRSFDDQTLHYSDWWRHFDELRNVLKIKILSQDAISQNQNVKELQFFMTKWFFGDISHDCHVKSIWNTKSSILFIHNFPWKSSDSSEVWVTFAWRKEKTYFLWLPLMIIPALSLDSDHKNTQRWTTFIELQYMTKIRSSKVY